MASKTDQQRYDAALAYLKTVDLNLGLDVDRKLQGKQAAVGGEISLEGGGFWHSGSDDQHNAIRALMLCQVAYFRPPHCRGNLADAAVLTQTKTAYKGKPIPEVKAEILNYSRLHTRSHDALANAAVEADQPGNNLDFVTYKRSDRHLGMNIICYNGVTVWLFKAGFVSKRWLAGPGNKIDANNADTAFGQGHVVQPAQWDAIPKGHLWSVQRRNDPTTCHWGVSLANGRAAGTNNTPGSLVLMLDFLTGGTLYGTYAFEQMCQVLNSDFKYGNLTKVMPPAPDTNIVVKTVDPMTSQALY